VEFAIVIFIYGKEVMKVQMGNSSKQQIEEYATRLPQGMKLQGWWKRSVRKYHPLTSSTKIARF
jgi:hypothetical protein